MQAGRALGAAALALLAAGCGSGRSSGPPEEALALPADTLEAEWAELPVAAALRGGRWVVVAGDWNAAVIADFTAKTLTPLGGSRQSGYSNPFAVFTSGDSIYLLDWGRLRTTVWTLDGKLVDSLPVAGALRGGYPRGRDAAAQLYFQVDPRPQRDGSGNRDSIPIVRGARTYERFDTVAQLAPRELAEVEREGTRRFEQRIFSGSDLWGLWPDGTVWIARRFRNRLETFDARGQRQVGPPLPDPVFEVTPADRERHLQSYPSEVRPRETELAWAVIHPPFLSGHTSPDGTVWLEKSKPALDTLRRIQVLDRGGALQRVMVLYGQARLLAVGEDKLLLGEQFEQGVRLMEVRIPQQRQPSTVNRQPDQP